MFHSVFRIHCKDLMCLCGRLQEVWACWCELLAYLEQENLFLDQLEQKLDETENLHEGTEELQEALEVSKLRSDQNILTDTRCTNQSRLALSSGTAQLFSDWILVKAEERSKEEPVGNQGSIIVLLMCQTCLRTRRISDCIPVTSNQAETKTGPVHDRTLTKVGSIQDYVIKRTFVSRKSCLHSSVAHREVEYGAQVPHWRTRNGKQ